LWVSLKSLKPSAGDADVQEVAKRLLVRKNLALFLFVGACIDTIVKLANWKAYSQALSPSPWYMLAIALTIRFATMAWFLKVYLAEAKKSRLESSQISN
jgi:hypothetical protein